jgi:uncharacterized RDD family membrane protein YckC
MASPRHCLVIGRDFELRANETADQVVVICGAAKIDGRINGDLISILGHVQLGSSAQLERSLIAVGGQVDIAPEATVRDDLFVVGGELKKALGFSPGRRQQLIGLPGFRGLSWLTDWVRHGLLRGLLLPLREAWLWTAALILFAFNLLLCLLFPRPLQVCTDAVCQRPVSALALGLLAVLLLGPVGLLLVLSCIGVVAFPFLFCALFLALAFGLIAVYRAVGHTLGRWLRLGILDQPIPALCLGTAVFYAGYCVPVLGFAIGGLGLLLGFGGALWALSGAVQREDSPRLVGVTPPPLASDTLSGAPLDLASLPRAGFGARLAALLIDLVILLILVCIPSPLAAAPVFSWLVYCAAFWAWRGATVGGMILGLRGVRPDGQPLGLGIAIVRALASLLSLVVLGLGFLWAAWDREGQTWHDKIAGTIVVRLPRPVPRPAAPPTAGVGMPPVSPVPPPAVPPVVPPPAAGDQPPPL